MGASEQACHEFLAAEGVEDWVVLAKAVSAADGPLRGLR